MRNKNYLVLFMVFLSPICLWSVVNPHNATLWIAEILPLAIGIIVMIKSTKHYPLTGFSYIIIFVGATLMLVGSHYSYSKVPVCEWIKISFDLDRNNFDKVVHFFQGFIMASLMKELILRKKITPSIYWINFFSLCYAIAVGAIWEILEWIFVLVMIFFNMEEPASGFLGTQNYYWDAQSDIFFAVVGALFAIFLFGKYHEKQIKKISQTTALC